MAREAITNIAAAGLLQVREQLRRDQRRLPGQI